MSFFHRLFVKINQPYALMQIAGSNCLAKWGHNQECLELDAVFNVDGRARVFSSLIPHGLPSLDFGVDVSLEYIEAATATLEKWRQQQYFQALSYDQRQQYFRSESRGYSRLPVEPGDINDINLLADHCQNCSVDDLLSGHTPRWFTDQQCRTFQKVAKQWRHKNLSYLDSKAEQFADFWVKQIGFLGTNGDLFSDLYHSALRSDQPPSTTADMDKFRQVLYGWAVQEFDKGRTPFLSTDYGPDFKLDRLLATNELSHLVSLLPWKTSLNLNFDDRPLVQCE